MNNKAIYNNVGKKFFLRNLKDQATDLRLKTISEIERDEIVSEAFTKFFVNRLDVDRLSITVKDNLIILNTKSKKVAKVHFDTLGKGFVLKNVEADETVKNQIQEKFENLVFNCDENELLCFISFETGYKCSKNANSREKLSINLMTPVKTVATIEVKYSMTRDMIKISKDFNSDEYKMPIEKALSKINVNEYTEREFLVNLINILYSKGLTSVIPSVVGYMYDIYHRIPKYFPEFKKLSEETKLSVMKNAYKRMKSSKDIYSCAQNTFYQLYAEVPQVLYTLNYNGRVYNKFFVKEEIKVPIWIGYTYQIRSNTYTLKESFMCHTLWLLLAGIKK